MKRRKRRIMAILLAFAMIFTMVDPSIFGGTITVQAEETTTVKKGWNEDRTVFYIGDNSNIEYLVNHYADENDDGKALRAAKYEVTDNIKLGESAKNGINIGTKDYPFQSVLNGNGYKISGLVYDEQVTTSGGLFSYLKGATIKDLIIEGATIRSNQYGGILAAQAEDSTIQNVTIIDSTCKVASLGAVVGLITTGGLYGGALVGYAKNTKIYNCESRDTKVHVDTTGGVQALGGDGMYMGGLVGWIEDGSILEYSRVVGGSVSTEYYVAVGALAANNLYAGGVVGCLDGDDARKAQVLDCFSSADVNYEGECYVSVGAGLSGYAGGIAARVSGSNYAMERCHYAGNIHGHLLNSILVLPIIAMEDYYLGGVAGTVKDTTYIKDCYFNWENAVAGNKYPGGPKLPAIWGESNTGEFTVIGSDQYSNPLKFDNFDFNGTVDRDTDNAAPFDVPHKNKWVINKNTNMPVHGNMIYAETDFPGAGTISFAATSIQEEKKTDGWTKEENPDDELANGISISQIAQTYSDMKEEVILTATTNEGYSFKGWSLKRDGVETDIPIEQYGSQGENYKLVLGGNSTSKYEYKDGDVFVAKYEAEVVFENLDGTAFATEQCIYKQIVNTRSKLPSAAGYIFLGWSTEKLPENLNSENLDSTTIEQITTWAEDNITITKTMHLYPVFILVGKYNVGVQMQSAVQKAGEEAYIKEATGSEGTAKICTDENGDIYITVEHVDKDGNPIEGINEENGYHFSGWYEVSDGETSKLVSRNKEYYLTNIDLTQKHQYEARYQYRVRAYIPVRPSGGKLKYITEASSASHFGDFYVDYNVSINKNGVISKPGFKEDEIKFVYWTNDVEDNWKKGDDISWGSSVTHLGGMEAKAYEFKFQEEQPVINIIAPMDAYGIVTWTGNLGDSYKPVIAQADFPLAVTEVAVTKATEAEKKGSSYSGGSVEAVLKIKDGYNIKGFREYTSNDHGGSWTLRDVANDDELSSIKIGNPWHTDFGYHTDLDTVLMSQITATINMYSLDNNDALDHTKLERKYNSLLFNPVNPEGTITETQDWDQMSTPYGATPYYTLPNETPIGVGNTKTDEEMYRPNYQFVGWITLTDESKMDVFGTMDLNEIVANKFVTENRASVDGYLLSPESKVTEAIDICPVYVPYKATFKTNFADSSVDNKPMLTDCIPTNDGVVTIMPPSVDGYVFQKWEFVTEDGISPEFTKNEDGSYTFEIRPEKTYTITAVYEATVSFKDAVKSSDGSISDMEENYLYNQPISNNMDKLPISYAPVNTNIDKIDMHDSEFNEDTYVFVGWKEYPYGSSETEIKESNLPTDYPFVSENDPIIGATNMVPVYTKPQITLNSNIEEKSEASVSVSKDGIVILEAPKQDGYVFNGWIREDGKTISTESTYVFTPEELREKHTYTASYDPIITYKIPVVDENNNLTGNYTEIKSSIPFGQAIIDPNKEYNNYNVRALAAVVTALENTEYVFEGSWSLEGQTEEYNYTSIITEPIVLEPILKKGLEIMIYSNLDDKEYTAKMIKDGDNLLFPIEKGLNIPTDVVEKGINGENVTPQFVGYSLVTIKEDGTRTSDGLYAIGQEIASTKLSEYNGTDSNKRIYAVWAQVQTIPREIMYFGGGEPEFSSGLLTMAAVNTSILKRAGIDRYMRYFVYSNGNNKVQANCGDKIWDDALYTSYFRDTAPDGWNVYGSVLFNIPKVLYNVELGFRSYIVFNYADQKKCTLYGDTEDKPNKCVVQTVASEMLKNLNDYSNLNLGTDDKDKLAQYAGYKDFNEYEGSLSN